MDDEQRVLLFVSLMEVVANDRGYGFRVRATETDAALFANRQSLLRWWMQVSPDFEPEAGKLRSWQKFTGDNLEFRLGVAIGAVVAQAWSDGAGDPLAQPTLEEWKETTGLPWFGFWCRELLRWGTVEPFVAFVLAQGLAGTRERAAARMPEFEVWLSQNVVEIHSEDRIDPRLFLKWQSSLRESAAETSDATSTVVLMTGSTGMRGTYNVTPIVRDGFLSWIDPAGYELARSIGPLAEGDVAHKCDYEIRLDGGVPFVRRTYFGRVQ